MFKLSLVLTIFSLYGCVKNSLNDPKDPRDKFIGAYTCTHTWGYSGHPDLCRISHGTDSVTIMVSKGQTDTTLNVFSIELCKVNDNTYKNCNYGQYDVSIKDNKISVYIGGGGTVCRWSDTYEGIKN